MSILPGPSPKKATKVVGAADDVAKRAPRRTFIDGAKTTAKTTSAYDARARLSTITQPQAFDTASDSMKAPVTTFGYDAANQLTSIKDPLERQTDYVYDLLGRVTQVTPPDPDGDPQSGEDAPTVSLHL